MAVPQPPGRLSDAAFRRTLVGVFLAVTVARSLHHVPWRDELHVWGVAETCRSVPDLFALTRYDAHCKLWYLLVLALHDLFGTFAAVQVAHALIATASVWVVARFSPFTRWQVALFALGYFPLFEYAVIARPYAIALLGAVAACAAWTHGGGRPFLLAAALFVLTQTGIYGVIVAGPIALAWIVHVAGGGGRASSVRGLAPMGGALLGTLLAAIQIIPPPDAMFDETHLGFDAALARTAVGLVWDALVPVPKFQSHFWNTNVLHGIETGSAAVTRALRAAPAAAAIAIAALITTSLARRRAALVVWVGVTLGMVGFCYVKYFGALRHHGHVFIGLVAACWIATHDARSRGTSDPAPVRRWDALRDRVFTAILVVQALVGVAVSAYESSVPFAATKECAQYLRQSGLDRLPIVGDTDWNAVSVAALLDVPVYLRPSDRWGRFVQWDKHRRDPVTEEEAIAAARRVALEKASDVVLLRSKPLLEIPPGVEPLIGLVAIVADDEDYYLYRVRRPD